jgi:hypothetical protein
MTSIVRVRFTYFIGETLAALHHRINRCQLEWRLKDFPYTVKLAIDSHVNILMMECARKICVAETLRDKIGSTIGIAGVVKMGNDD